MQIVVEQIELEKRDASDLVVGLSFFNDSSSKQARDRNLKKKQKNT